MARGSSSACTLCDATEEETVWVLGRAPEVCPGLSHGFGSYVSGEDDGCLPGPPKLGKVWTLERIHVTAERRTRRGRARTPGDVAADGCWAEPLKFAQD